MAAFILSTKNLSTKGNKYTVFPERDDEDIMLLDLDHLSTPAATSSTSLYREIVGKLREPSVVAAADAKLAKKRSKSANNIMGLLNVKRVSSSNKNTQKESKSNSDLKTNIKKTKHPLMGDITSSGDAPLARTLSSPAAENNGSNRSKRSKSPMRRVTSEKLSGSAVVTSSSHSRSTRNRVKVRSSKSNSQQLDEDDEDLGAALAIPPPKVKVRRSRSDPHVFQDEGNSKFTKSLTKRPSKKSPSRTKLDPTKVEKTTSGSRTSSNSNRKPRKNSFPTRHSRSSLLNFQQQQQQQQQQQTANSNNNQNGSVNAEWKSSAAGSTKVKLSRPSSTGSLLGALGRSTTLPMSIHKRSSHGNAEWSSHHTSRRQNSNNDGAPPNFKRTLTTGSGLPGHRRTLSAPRNADGELRRTASSQNASSMLPGGVRRTLSTSRIHMGGAQSQQLRRTVSTTDTRQRNITNNNNSDHTASRRQRRSSRVHRFASNNNVLRGQLKQNLDSQLHMQQEIETTALQLARMCTMSGCEANEEELEIIMKANVLKDARSYFDVSSVSSSNDEPPPSQAVDSPIVVPPVPTATTNSFQGIGRQNSIRARMDSITSIQSRMDAMQSSDNIAKESASRSMLQADRASLDQVTTVSSETADAQGLSAQQNNARSYLASYLANGDSANATTDNMLLTAGPASMISSDGVNSKRLARQQSALAKLAAVEAIEEITKTSTHTSLLNADNSASSNDTEEGDELIPTDRQEDLDQASKHSSIPTGSRRGSAFRNTPDIVLPTTKGPKGPRRRMTAKKPRNVDDEHYNDLDSSSEFSFECDSDDEEFLVNNAQREDNFVDNDDDQDDDSEHTVFELPLALVQGASKAVGEAVGGVLTDMNDAARRSSENFRLGVNAVSMLGVGATQSLTRSMSFKIAPPSQNVPFGPANAESSLLQARPAPQEQVALPNESKNESNLLRATPPSPTQIISCKESRTESKLIHTKPATSSQAISAKESTSRLLQVESTSQAQVAISREKRKSTTKVITSIRVAPRIKDTTQIEPAPPAQVVLPNRREGETRRSVSLAQGSIKEKSKTRTNGIPPNRAAPIAKKKTRAKSASLTPTVVPQEQSKTDDTFLLEAKDKEISDLRNQLFLQAKDKEIAELKQQLYESQCKTNSLVDANTTLSAQLAVYLENDK